jgi:hypothetical protein
VRVAWNSVLKSEDQKRGRPNMSRSLKSMLVKLSSGDHLHQLGLDQTVLIIGARDKELGEAEKASEP